MTTIQHEFEEKVVAENIDFETYLREFDGRHAEFYDGKVILMSPSTGEHNEIVGFIFILFNSYLGLTKLGKVRVEKVAMRMVVDGVVNSPEPDLFVVVGENLANLTETYMDGAADLVVEVISAESEDRDRGKKFTLYEKAGVREYWLVDPLRKESYFYLLNENRRFNLKLPDQRGIYHSTVLPKFKLEVALLHREQVPDANEAVELVKAMLKQG